MANTPSAGTGAPPLTYALLLELYRGRGSIVEQLTEAERGAMSIETPLFQFIREAAARPSPRHIFLTGNAGDGKTFAILTLPASGFTKIMDASARDSSATAPPIEHLAARMEEALRREERLLVAINRGQLERLESYAGTRSGPLATLMEQARAQSRLRPVWEANAPDPQVALIDLGVIDTLSDAVLRPMLERLSAAEAGPGMSAATRTAFDAALSALGDARAHDWIRHALSAARAQGHHATMRELWSFFAFLITGAREADSSAPVSVEDALGARLFSERARGTLFEHVRERTDPAFISDPAVVRQCILGSAADTLRDIEGVRPLVNSAEDADGRSLRRVLAVHSPRVAMPDAIDDEFTTLISYLLSQQQGWHAMPSVTDDLLQGIYWQLRLPRSRREFPAWQTLCYDSARLPEAASVANGEINAAQLRLALPRPNPTCEAALRGAWRAPYVWLSSAARPGESGDVQVARGLRLTPRLFARLYRNTYERLTDTELFTLRKWITTAQAATRDATADADRVEVGVQRGDGGAQWLILRRDPLSDSIRLEWEVT
jgi:hypothetical protein